MASVDHNPTTASGGKNRLPPVEMKQKIEEWELKFLWKSN
jgi:hypothetical protein